jgi:hypothetical protein
VCVCAYVCVCVFVCCVCVCIRAPCQVKSNISSMLAQRGVSARSGPRLNRMHVLDIEKDAL